jgi:hypothetical protein
MGSLDRYVRRLGRLEKQVFNLATKTRLDHSSIENGALEVHDEYGETTAVIGVQYDGTTAAAPVGGLPTPQPTIPMVTPVVGGLRIYWDGSFVNGAVSPMNFRRITLHAVTDVDLFSPTDAGQIVAEIATATGAEVDVTLPAYVEYYIFAVAWTQAGKFSVPSDPAFGIPLKVNTDDLVHGSVTEEVLGNAAVTMDKIDRWAITEDKISDFAVAVTKFRTTTHMIY